MYYKFTETECAELISTLNGAKQSISSLREDKARLEKDVEYLKEQLERWQSRYVNLVSQRENPLED